ncbi:hypothetical protein [Burkholderia ubonensis]|uniref:hypothetical protein n=1 Tax=Burkholderia ubonensis TaxID=101571 RepID=UPI0012F83192|nr:hypothetical protein [Burkholderia ubonensis]
MINVEMEGIGGAVIRVLRGLSRLDLAVVIAAAVPSGHPSGVRRAAIELIAAFALPAKLVKRVDSGLARRLIARHFGSRIDYRELGEIYDLDPSNVRRRARLVSDAIEFEERATWDRLASLLRDIGALSIETHLARGT